MTTLPLISIVFPVHNGGKNPTNCLFSIASLTYPKSKVEVIVINNHSTDNSVKKLDLIIKKVQVISLPKNLGFAKAINLGVQIAKGEYIFITNDDIIFHKQSLTHLVSHLETHPDVGIVGGKIFSTLHPHHVSSAGYFMNRWTSEVYSSLSINSITEPDWIQGCALLTRKRLFETVGGMDVGFEHFFEDFDFCLRVKKVGYKVEYLPQAYFWHGESTTANKNQQNKYYWWYKTKFRFVIKQLPWHYVLSQIFAQTFIIIPSRTLVLHDGRLIPFFKGLWWNIVHLSETLSARYANT